jgi:hypothetical protein
MEYVPVFGIAAIGVVVLALVAFVLNKNRIARMSPDERRAYRRASRARRKKLLGDSTKSTWGASNAVMVCPHCQQKGNIRTKMVDRKKGISGGKATAAILTGGVSIVATGLSRRERMTQARCGTCGNTWDF